MNIKDKKISHLSVLLLIVLLSFMSLFSVNTNYVKAEETDSRTQAQKIVDSAQFITFKKNETPSDGKIMTVCYYIPKEVYDGKSTYQTIICPKFYLDKYNIRDNYQEELESHYPRILIVSAEQLQDAQSIPQGKVAKMGIGHLKESNCDLEFAFIMFVEDETGARAYCKPVYATYNTLQAKNYTNEEMQQMIERKISIDSNFNGIVTKITELVNSFWKYIVMALGGVIVVWGAYVGIKIAIAKKNDEKINARGMVKNLIIGIVIMFVLASGVPLLINGLSAWL